MGADLDEPLKSTAAVLHIGDPYNSVTAEDVLGRLEAPADEDDGYTPLPEGTTVEDGETPEREFALRFSPAAPTDPKDAEGHRLGGHAEFVQEDPRPWEDELRPYTVQLLQLDSDESGLCWGDMGVGHFFVTEDQAKARDYSRVLYTWDCGWPAPARRDDDGTRRLNRAARPPAPAPLSAAAPPGRAGPPAARRPGDGPRRRPARGPRGRASRAS